MLNRNINMKTYIFISIAVLLLGAVGVGAYVFMKNSADTGINENNVTQPQNEEEVDDFMASEEPEQEDNKPETVIGSSVEGRDIAAYHYGEGDTELVFMGGIHGGYEWNTALVAYEFMDYVQANPGMIPDGIKITVIPVLNPDGLQKIVGTSGRFTPANVPASQTATIPGRFNANNVDLNRNFDCDWQSVGTWQNRNVDGGTRAFSEPESQAFRDYIQTASPAAVVVWYSAAGGVFASNCHNGVLSETNEITNVYAQASGYPSYREFNFYEITGDAVNWLAKNNIPAISVLLSNHTDTEWSKNRAGIEALLEYYAN